MPRPTGQYIHMAEAQAQTRGKEQAEGSRIWPRTGALRSWALDCRSSIPDRAVGLRGAEFPQGLELGGRALRAREQSDGWIWTVRVAKGLSEHGLKGWFGAARFPRQGCRDEEAAEEVKAS